MCSNVCSNNKDFKLIRGKFMRLKYSILALGIGAVLGSTVIASDAEAGAYGSSIFEVKNFFLVNADGNTPAGISILSDNRNGEVAVGLNGVNNSNTGNASGSADLDLAPVLLGTSTPVLANNSQVILPGGSGTFSRSDFFVSGAIFGEGGRGFSRSDAYALNGGHEGNSNSTIANNVLATYEITVDADVQGRFLLDSDVFLKASVSNDLFSTSSSANASISFSIDVSQIGGGSILSWSPGELNRGVSVFGSAGANESGGFNSYTGLSSGLIDIAAGSYTVTIQQKSTARQMAIQGPTEVPEPGIIALIALGLVGIGFAGRTNSRRSV